MDLLLDITSRIKALEQQEATPVNDLGSAFSNLELPKSTSEDLEHLNESLGSNVQLKNELVLI